METAKRPDQPDPIILHMIPNRKTDNQKPDIEIVSTRIFNVKQKLMFKAWSDPNHLKNWWGPEGFTNTFEEFDFKPGGRWKFIMHGPDGTDYENESVFTAISEPDMIGWDHISGHKFKVQVHLQQQGIRTKVTFKMVFESERECQKLKGIIVPSNEQNFDRLEKELERMKS
jgi:uncharacterized protein YndB with AHSA1/START domain